MLLGSPKESPQFIEGEENEYQGEDGRQGRGGICTTDGRRERGGEGSREQDGVVGSREPGGALGEVRVDGGAGRDFGHGHGRGEGEVAVRRWCLDGVRERLERYHGSHLLNHGKENGHHEADCGADGHVGGDHVHGGGGGGGVVDARGSQRAISAMRVERWWSCGGVVTSDKKEAGGATVCFVPM
jgi:hypothetical protein